MKFVPMQPSIAERANGKPFFVKAQIKEAAVAMRKVLGGIVMASS